MKNKRYTLQWRMIHLFPKKMFFAAKRFLAAGIQCFIYSSFVFASFSYGGSIYQPDSLAIREVAAGLRDSANAVWWGFDSVNVTSKLQAAINSRATKLIIPNVGKPWIVDPLWLSSNKQITLESGVVLKARKGSFLGTSDCLLRGYDKQNITIIGYGAEMIMNKEDYTVSPYSKSEGRHCLSIGGCSNVNIFGLRIVKSGGDGIYVGRGTINKYCSNIQIKDVVCDSNYRQGISVISAQNLLIENCVLKNTHGTDPQAGIDFEPNNYDEPLINCTLRKCIISNNKIGINLYLGMRTQSSQPVSIKIDSCVVQNNDLYPFDLNGSITPVSYLGYIVLHDNQFTGTQWKYRATGLDILYEYPTVSVAPSSLSFGNVIVNTISSEKTYTLQGSNLSPPSGSITITPPSGYQVSSASGSGFGSSLNVSYTGNALASKTIYTRFSPAALQSYTGNITNSGGSAITKNAAVTGTGASALTPALTVTPASLSLGNVIVNTNSSESTYIMAGSNLSPAADSLTITAPAGFTISTVSGSGFGSSKKIAYTGGTLSAKTIYVRFSPAAVQSYTGNITCSGGGATTKNVAVTGTGVSAPTPILAINPATLSFGDVVVNTISSEKTYTLTGSDLSPASSSLTITAPSGFTISTVSGSDFTSAKTIAYTGGTLSAKTIYVRFTPTVAQSYTGNITSAGGGAATKNVALTGTGISAPTPILTVNPAIISFGETVVNTISGERAYTLAGSNLSPSTDSLTITAPAGFTISTVSGSGFTSSKRIAYTGGTFSAKTIYIRFNPAAIQNYTGNITNTGGGITTKNVSVTGAGVSTPTPILTVNPTSLSFGDIIINTISSEQAYILTGSNLSPTADSLTITAPAGFTISTVSGSGFTSSKKIAYTGGTLTAKTIFVKFSPILIQNYSGNITNEGGGAILKNAAVTGSGINAPSPVITINSGTLAFSTVRINTISSEIAYSLKGSNLSPTIGSIIITAPTGYQVSVTSGSGFSSSISVEYNNGALTETNIYVIFSPTAVQNYNGNITNAGGGAVTQNAAVTGTGIPITSAALTVNPTSLSFGDVAINANSKELSYALTGLNLFPASDSLTITAPPGFTISTASGSGFASKKRIAYVSGRLQPIPKIIYVRFSPTAIQSYSDSIINSGGSAATMSLHVSGNGISDLPAPTGTFIASSDTLETRGGSVTLTWTSTNASSVSLNNGIGAVDLNGTITRTVRSTTRFILTLSNVNGTASYVKTIYVKPRKLSENKALYKPSTASSIELTGSEANKANDGNVTTSWSSAYVDNQWWQVDLQNITTIENVSLIWNESYASLFTIGTSLDGMIFNEVATGYASGSDTVELNFDPINTRYLRLTGIERGTEFGISLSELGIFESESVTTSVDQSVAVPNSFVLEQNFPNPFNPSTQIGYQLSKTAEVQLVVYDILGKEIATLVNQLQYAGHHTVTFNAKNLASGIYYARLNAEGKVQIRKMMLIK